jgi:phosphohistidine phosphatase
VAAGTLVLIRHAKAADGAVDAERPLAPRGRRDAAAVGEWLAELGIAPDRVVVSPALRARETWERAAARLSAAPDPVLDGRIYENEMDALLEVIRETPDQTGTLVLVGHNPSFGQLAYDLDDGTGDEEARQELLAGYPTSAVAVYESPADWAEVRARSLRLAAFAAPRG